MMHSDFPGGHPSGPAVSELPRHRHSRCPLYAQFICGPRRLVYDTIDYSTLMTTYAAARERSRRRRFPLFCVCDWPDDGGSRRDVALTGGRGRLTAHINVSLDCTKIMQVLKR